MAHLLLTSDVSMMDPLGLIPKPLDWVDSEEEEG